jgi:NAD(P)-dependent dehydrogenase (short-subunit alcohol dehydrogenase family)
MSGERGWAVILGASCGTGAAVARQLAVDPGLDIFGMHRGRHPELAQQVERDVRAAGRSLHYRIGDAGTAEGAEQGAEELLRVAGPRSVNLFLHSIANASVGQLTSGDEHQLQPWQLQKTFESMANSFVYWAQALLSRDLLAPSARLLGLTNPFDEVVLRNTVAIGASKAALGVYVRYLAQELGVLGHRVNLLRFGAVITPAVEKTFGAAKLEHVRGVFEQAVPARRLCTVEEVARFVSVLAGEAGAWFNGATIDFTGAEEQALLDLLIHRRSPAS